jgi:hypothetical protein
MSLLIALSRHRLHSSNLGLLCRLQFEASHSRHASSSSRVSQLDPLLVEVLNAPEQPPTGTPVDAAKVDLPHTDEWRRHFPALVATYHRVSIRNPTTAARLANAFVPAGSEGKVVIEAFPGASIGAVSFGGSISFNWGGE